MTAVEHFIKNIYDEDSRYLTKLQQIGEFIAYLNERNISTEEKIESTIKVLDKINSLKKYENIMMDNSDNFYDSIRLSFEIERLIDKLYCYANLSFDLDTITIFS